MIAQLVLAAFAWVLWAAGAETQEACELAGRHQAAGFPKIRKEDGAITPVGERAVILAQVDAAAGCGW
jgi:hypothetical protein